MQRVSQQMFMLACVIGILLLRKLLNRYLHIYISPNWFRLPTSLSLSQFLLFFLFLLKKKKYFKENKIQLLFAIMQLFCTGYSGRIRELLTTFGSLFRFFFFIVKCAVFICFKVRQSKITFI